MPAGRPSDFREEFSEQAEKLCALGATDSDLANFFGVCTRTISRWLVEFPEFSQSVKNSKEKADERVERSLFHRAMGYSHPAVKIFLPKDADEPVYAPYTEHVAPDTTAQIFWLKNRRPAEWRDRQNVEHSGTVTTIEHRTIDVMMLSPETRDALRQALLEQPEAQVIEGEVSPDGLDDGE